MSRVKGGNNIIKEQLVFEKETVLSFHKGFVLTTTQSAEIDALLAEHDFDGLEHFLAQHFEEEDVSMVRPMIECQKRLEKSGYYKSTERL